MQDIEEAEDADPMYDKARALAEEHTRISTSLLQRRLRIGYPRAARIMDRLEEEGIVGGGGSGGSRDVVVMDRDLDAGDALDDGEPGFHAPKHNPWRRRLGRDDAGEDGPDLRAGSRDCDLGRHRDSFPGQDSIRQISDH